jgi:hypothetical protein
MVPAPRLFVGNIGVSAVIACLGLAPTGTCSDGIGYSQIVSRR